MYCKFDNFCVLGGGVSCREGYCDERERLSKLENERCPVMVKRDGYVDNTLDCDIPFWLRALIPHNIPCAKGNKCILGNFRQKI